MSSRSPLVTTSHLVLITILSDGHGRFIRWETEVAYRPVCLDLATADICGWIIVCWGICPVLHVAGPLALTRCQQPPYQLIQPKVSPDLKKCPLEHNLPSLSRDHGHRASGAGRTRTNPPTPSTEAQTCRSCCLWRTT